MAAGAELVAFVTFVVGIVGMLATLFLLDLPSTLGLPIVASVPVTTVVVVMAAYAIAKAGIFGIETIGWLCRKLLNVYDTGVSFIVHVGCAVFESWHALMRKVLAKTITSDERVAKFCSRLALSVGATLAAYGFALSRGFTGPHAAGVAIAGCALLTNLILIIQCYPAAFLVKFLELATLSSLSAPTPNKIDVLIGYAIFFYIFEVGYFAAGETSDWLPSATHPPSSLPSPLESTPAPVHSTGAVKRRKSSRGTASRDAEAK